MKSVHAVPALQVRAQRATVDLPRAYPSVLLALAGVLLINSILGPLALGVVSYPITDTVESQLIGLELVTVFLVVPWASIAGVAALRGHPAAPLLGFAPSAYAAYMFVQYVLGPEYSHYTLTALAQVAICALAGGSMLWSWSLARRVPLLPMRREWANRNAVLLLALAAFVLLRYSSAVTGAFSGSAIEREFAQERTFYWSIFLLDLGVVVPCTVAAALSLRRGTAVGHRALYAVVGWFALVPPSLGGSDGCGHVGEERPQRIHAHGVAVERSVRGLWRRRLAHIQTTSERPTTGRPTTREERSMKALVVYESMFGNTEEIAQAIGAGLAEDMEVEVQAVAKAPRTVPSGVELLVVGGPTHAFSMSRQSTREDAVKQGANATPSIGVREWLEALPHRSGTATVTTFDTQVDGARHLPGSAAKSAARRARRHGFTHVERGESFYVHGTAGPLVDGETERARDWGRKVARTVSAWTQEHRA
jgi:hypothetical protein